MDVTYQGSNYTIPDDIQYREDALDYINTHLKKPNMLERVGGNLTLGTSDLVKNISNIGGLIGLDNFHQGGEDLAKYIASADMARKVEAQPATSTIGQIGEGLVRFLPEVPLWATGEGAVMRGLSLIPKVSKLAHALTPIAGEGIIPGTVKAAGRAGLTGAAVGPLIAEPDATLGQRLEKGYEEAKGFAIGVGILHPVFAGLRYAVGKALKKRTNRVQDNDVQTVMDNPEASEKLLKDPEVREQLKAYQDAQREAQSDVISGENFTEGDIGRMKGDKEDTQGIQSSERIGEEPISGRPIGEAGEAQAGAGRVVQESPTGEAPLEAQKKISIKYVTDEQAQMLTQSGMKRADIEAAVKDVVDGIPQNERLLDKRLQGYAYTREQIAGMSKQKKIDAVTRAEVDETLAEKMRDVEPTSVKAPQPQVTREEATRIAEERDARIRATMQERTVKQAEKLKEMGHADEDIAKMSDQQRADAIDKGVTVKAKAVVGKVQESSDPITESDITDLEDIVKDARLGSVAAGEADAYAKRAELIRQRVEALKGKGRSEGPSATSPIAPVEKVEKTRRQKRVEPVDEVPVDENVDWEAKLREEGMPEELDFESDSGFTLDSLGFQQLYEASLKVARTLTGEHPAQRIEEKIQTAGGTELNVRDVRKLEKITPLSDLFRVGARVAAKAGKVVDDMWYKLQLADLDHKWWSKEDLTTFRSILNDMSDEQVARLRDITDGKMKPADVKEAKKAAELRNLLDMKWEKMQASRLNEIRENLSDNEYKAVMSVIEGRTPIEELKKFDKKTARALTRVASDYMKFEGKRVEEYLPHVMKGSLLIRTVREDGKPGNIVSIGLNREDALRKIEAWAEANPDKPKSFIIDSNYGLLDVAVGNKLHSYKVNARVANMMADEIKGMEADLKEIGKGFALKPADKFSPYLKRRVGRLPGDDDLKEIITSYLYSVNKKLALDPVLKEARRVINEDLAGQPNAQNFLLNTVDAIKGKYWAEDQMLDTLAKSFGIDTSMSASRLSGRIREAEGVLKLGYRPVSALFNYLGGQSNIWVKNGTSIYFKARNFVKTPEGKQFLKEEERYLGDMYVREAEGGEIAAEAKWYKPLGMFGIAELPNRTIGLAANYIYAMERLGLKGDAAREYARRQNWFQQGLYSISNMPRAIRSPMGRTVGQFKFYMVNQLEFMASLRGPEVARFMIAQMALGGPRGAVMLMKSLPVLCLATPWWDDLEEYLNKNYGTAYRGVGGAVGLDVSAPATFQFPQSLDDWMGPALKDVVNVYSRILKPLLNKEEPMPATFGDVIGKGVDVAEQVSPLVKLWPKLVIDKIANPTQDGFIIKDDRGREMYRLSDTEFWKPILGAQPLEVSRIQTEEGILNRRDRATQKRKAYIVDKIMDFMESGEDMPDSIWDEMLDLGIKPTSIRREAKLRSLPPDMRRIMQTELAKRGDVADVYPTIGD